MFININSFIAVIGKVKKMILFSQKVPFKNFSKEVRAAVDVRHFLDNTYLLLSVQETNADLIVQALLSKMLHDVGDVTVVEQTKMALFTHDKSQLENLLTTKYVSQISYNPNVEKLIYILLLFKHLYYWKCKGENSLSHRCYCDFDEKCTSKTTSKCHNDSQYFFLVKVCNHVCEHYDIICIHNNSFSNLNYI